jgi:glutamate carboxypeptidase
LTRTADAPAFDTDEILDGIRRWVEIETPTSDAAAVNRLMDVVAGELGGLGFGLERTPGRDGFGDILRARSPWGSEGPGILVLSHLDTVHPTGTIETLRFRREGDAAYGPGIYDMKGGAYLAVHAARHLARAGRETALPITFLFAPDEEVGSPTSRAAIEREGARAKYVLVTEPARDGGCCVTGRKGVARFEIRTRGRPAHSGSRHEDGRSAIREMARQVLTIEAMTDYSRGITTTVGLISGGTAANVVPAECRASIDLRFPDADTGDRAVAAIRGLTPVDPDVGIEVTGGINRPAYTKTEAIQALYEHARGLGAELGLRLGEVPLTGGASDGNFTAALGVPTLDGLGVDGEGAHTMHERIDCRTLAGRAALWVRLFETLR